MKKKRILKDSPPPSRVERYTVGDGLTKREMVSVTGLQNPSPSDEAIAAIHAIFEHAGKVSTFAGRLAFAVKWAGGILDRKAGASRLPFESEAWYAEEILSEAGRLGRMVSRIQADPEAARKEADALALWTLELGFLISEAAHKFNFEADALLGQGDRQTRRRGGLTTGQRTREAAGERNADVLRRNAELLAKKWPENKRAVYIADEMKRSRHTIRGIIRRDK
jgi:hypothetical protein